MCHSPLTRLYTAVDFFLHFMTILLHIDQSLQWPCKKAAALENISQEMNVAGWYITHDNAALGTKTRLTCFALIGCTLFNWVSCIADRRRQLSCVGEGVYSDATQLNPRIMIQQGPQEH